MNLKVIVGLCVLIVLTTAVVIPVVSENEDLESSTLDVLIIGGQSNAEYGDTYVCDPVALNEEYAAIPSHNLYYFGTSHAPGNQWTWSHELNYSWAAYHLHEMYDGSKWTIGGYEPILGNSLAERSGHDVLVVNMGVGGRAIEMLLPDGADGDYSWGVLERALHQAKDKYAHINMAGVVWIQGESDHDTPVDQYIESFGKLETAYEHYGAEDFYIVHTRDYFGGNANIAQEQIAADNSNVMIATYITDTFTMDNGMLASNADIHYSQKGRTAIALDIQDKIIVPESESYPGIELIKIIPLVIIVGLVIVTIRYVINTRD